MRLGSETESVNVDEEANRLSKIHVKTKTRFLQLQRDSKVNAMSMSKLNKIESNEVYQRLDRI
jgi:hypothetical protein